MLTVDLGDIRGRNESSLEELELAALYEGHTIVSTQFGIVRQHDFTHSGRHCVYILPDTITEDTKIFLYYHGSRGNAWMSALYETRWIEKSNLENMIVVFGQAEGVKEDAHVHEHYGYVSYGELYWEIRDNSEQFKRDIEYTKDIIKYFSSIIVCKNTPKVYFTGHSNGGVFACLLAIYLSNYFSAIVSSCGGIGWDPYFYLDFQQHQGINIPPLLFYTGEHDIHRKPCESAREVFLCENATIVDLYVKPNLGHHYHYDCEKYILDWIHRLPSIV